MPASSFSALDQHRVANPSGRDVASEEDRATTAVQGSEDVVPASQLREAYAKIRELERALGRKTMEVEILRAAQEIVKKTPSLRRESAR